MVVHTSFFKSQSSQLIRAEGGVRREAELILRALTIRGIEVIDAVSDRVTACTDRDTLDRWLDRAYDHSVVRAEDIFTDA
jgi:hypothetical protein